MRDELKTFLKHTSGHPPTEWVPGKPIDDDYSAAFMALWEEVSLSRELTVVERKSGPTRRPRI